MLPKEGSTETEMRRPLLTLCCWGVSPIYNITLWSSPYCTAPRSTCLHITVPATGNELLSGQHHKTVAVLGSPQVWTYVCKSVCRCYFPSSLLLIRFCCYKTHLVKERFEMRKEKIKLLHVNEIANFAVIPSYLVRFLWILKMIPLAKQACL